MVFDYVPENGEVSRPAHAADVPFVFGTLSALGLTGPLVPTAADRAVSQTMMASWLAFASGGDPNGRAAPRWPRHDGTDPYLRVGVPTEARSDFRRADCDFWDGLAR